MKLHRSLLTYYYLSQSISSRSYLRQPHYESTFRALLYQPLTSTSHSSSLSKNPKKTFDLTNPVRQFSTTVSNPISLSSDPSSSIDAGSSIRKPSSLWPGMYHSPVTNALWEARSNYFGSDNGGSIANKENELEVKTPEDSRTRIDYKFSSDYVLKEQYRNPWNEVRMGKLVEDLDALAGTISFKVDVGNFLHFKSRVLYTELENPSKPLINIEVVANVTRPEVRSSEVSNKFYFTFTIRPEAMIDGWKLRHVVPATEEEARVVIERMDAEHSEIDKCV